METLAIGIIGARGKMGQQIIELAEADPRYRIAGLSKSLEETESAMANCQVVIDFSSMQSAQAHIAIAKNLKKALVVGTTGLDSQTLDAIRSASEQIPIMYSANFSLGIALCLETVSRFAAAIGDPCHIEIVETHHIHKKDCPSGTALALSKAIGKADVPICSIRSQDVVGEHSVIFEWGHERIELTHKAHSRKAFAQGALLAASFLAHQPPGLYSIKDLFRK